MSSEMVEGKLPEAEREHFNTLVKQQLLTISNAA